MSLREARTILFDWDGTLLDSFSASYEASMAVYRHFGIEMDRERFMDTYSPNWLESYRELGIPEDDWDAANQIWLKAYHDQSSPLFSSAREDVAALARYGFRLGIVTSGNRDRVVRELKMHGLEDQFSVLVCAEDTERKKPDPAPLACALERLREQVHRTIYVGDRPEDISMGKTLGTFTVGVVSEYGPLPVLKNADPDLLCHSTSEMVAHLSG